MANPLAHLQRRKKDILKQLAELQKELKEIERVEKSVLDLAAKLAPVVDESSEDERGGGPQSRNRSGTRPAQVIKAVKGILINSQNPMSRSEILARLSSQGVDIIGSNPANTLGTTLSRAPKTFINLKGFGYWLVERPYGPANYSPAGGGAESADTEVEAQAVMH